MHKPLFLAISLMLFSAATLVAQTQAQPDPASSQQTPASSMSGMDMGGTDMSNPASSSQSSNQPSSSQSADKSKSTSDECPCMKMMQMGSSMGSSGGSSGSAQMKMDGGTDKSKSMDMGNGKSMEMGKGDSMDMSGCMKMMHGAMDHSSAAPIPAGSMRIAFSGKTADWTQTTLAALPHSTVTVYNEKTKTNETYSGVPLLDLLVRLGVNEKPSGKDVMLYVVAAGTDGYSALYSMGEIAPYIHDASVIVADSRNGKPLTAAGPFELIASREKHPARWVHNLARVTVLPAQ